MMGIPSHLIVLVIALLVGAWLGVKYPQVNLLGKITG